MAWWEVRERWRATDELGYGKPRELELLEINDVFVKGWRVSWRDARAQAPSFVDRNHPRADDRERLAREALTAKMAELGGTWARIDPH